MSCVFFVIGLILAALDLYIDTMDILVDAAGFLVILCSLLPLLVRRQFPLPHLIWPFGALLCSILLWIPGNSLRFFCTIAQNLCFWLLLWALGRCMFPHREKGSNERILYQSYLTANLFLMISKTFGGLLSAVEIIGILILFFQIVLLIFEIIITWRRWPARMID
ncbi:MAG: hypothetical protein ACLU6B_02975 [Lachnospirales bacterium]